MIPGARSDAIAQARQILASKPVYLDTETTGTGEMDTIVEIAIVDHDGSVLLDTLVKPVGKIPLDAYRIHGISNEMVANAPPWSQVWNDVYKILSNRVVAIYNADFDIRLMQQTHRLNWMKWSDPPGTEYVCLMKLYAQFYGKPHPSRGGYQWQSLEEAGRQAGITLPNTHRAKDDTLLTRELLLYMASFSP